MASRYFGSRGPIRPHLLRSGASRDITDLRSDVEAAFLQQQSEAGGTTAARPTSPFVGQQYFDVTLAKPLVWNGSEWIGVVAAPTAQTLDIYVSAANGDDANDGLTPATAVQTLEAAWALVPSELAGLVIIHGSSGDYVWKAPRAPSMATKNARVYLVGDGGGQAGEDGFTTVVTGTAQGGTTTSALVLEVAALSNAYYGLTLITNNSYTTIKRNSSSTVYPNVAITGLSSGDAYRVAEPSMRITFAAEPGKYTSAEQIVAFNGIFLVNVAFEGTTTQDRIWAKDSIIGLYGVVFNPGALQCSSCDVEMGALYAHTQVLSDLGWSVTSLAGWGLSNKNDASFDYSTTHQFDRSWLGTGDDYHYLNVTYFQLYSCSFGRFAGGSFYGCYCILSRVYIYDEFQFYGVDSFMGFQFCDYQVRGVNSTEQTWGGTGVACYHSQGTFHWLTVTGSSSNTVYYEGGVNYLDDINGSNNINASNTTNCAIYVGNGAVLDVYGATTCVGHIRAHRGGEFILEAGEALTANGLYSTNGVFMLGGTTTINAAAATTAARIWNGSNLILTGGTLTLTAGANIALSLSEGSELDLAGGNLTASSTHATQTAYCLNSDISVSSGTLTLPNTGGGIGLLLEGASRYGQDGGAAAISTNTNATGATVVRGSSNMGVAAGTFSSTAGTGNGAGLRCYQGGRASFAISPTLTGGSGGSGAGINVRGGGYVTLANDPTAGVTGSGGAAGAINVSGALEAVGALSGSYGAVVDATTLSGIARAA